MNDISERFGKESVIILGLIFRFSAIFRQFGWFCGQAVGVR